MKPTKPGVYILNGRPCLVGMDKGTLKVCWLDASGEFQKARVWDKELKDARWQASEEGK
jgi:hypothetical protein